MVYTVYVRNTHGELLEDGVQFELPQQDVEMNRWVEMLERQYDTNDIHVETC